MNFTARLLLALALAATACGTSSTPTDGGPAPTTDGGSSPDGGSGPTTDGGDWLGTDGGLPQQVDGGPVTPLSCNAPPANATTVSAVVSGNTQFAVDMFGQLAAAAKGGNVFYSPLSVSTSLAMTYMGAQGDTATQMATTLHFPALGNQDLAAGFGTLACELTADGQAPDSGQVDLANAVFGQQGATFEAPFIGLLSADFGAPLLSLDFAGNPDGARQSINRWVSDHTDGMIPNLLQPGSITPDMRIALADALYFDEHWQTPFEKGGTQMAAFQVAHQSSVMVPMMSGAIFAGYSEDASGAQMVELPLEGGKTAIDFFLPGQGASPDPVTNLAGLEARMTASNLQTWFSGTQAQQVLVQIPQFKIDLAANLIPPFQALGMTVPFDPTSADFSGIDGAKDLYIGLIQHEAVLNVDEAGVTAAAATVTGVVGSAAPEWQHTFTANRPFSVIIRDLPTGTILFEGQVTNPTK